MKIFKNCLVVVGMGIIAGCSNEGLVNENGKLKRERTEKNAEIAQLQGRYALLDESNRSLQNKNGHLEAEIARINADIDRLKGTIRDKWIRTEYPQIQELKARLQNLDADRGKVVDKGSEVYDRLSTERNKLAKTIQDLENVAKTAYEKYRGRYIEEIKE